MIPQFLNVRILQYLCDKLATNLSLTLGVRLGQN